MILRFFGFVLMLIGLGVIGYAIISSMYYTDIISTYSSMYGSSLPSNYRGEMLMSFSWPGIIAGLLIFGIGLLAAKK